MEAGSSFMSHPLLDCSLGGIQAFIYCDKSYPAKNNLEEKGAMKAGT